MFYVSMLLIDGIQESVITNIEGSTFGALFQGESGNIAIVFNFIIITAFMIASLVIAKKLGAVGAEMVIKWGHNARKWGQSAIGGATFGLAGLAGRHTIGRVASRVARSRGFQEFAGRSWTGEKLLKATRGVAKSSFDVRGTNAYQKTIGSSGASLGTAFGQGGFDERVRTGVEKRSQFGGSLDLSAQARESYARRQITGIPGRFSIFGTVGRKNRVVGAEIIHNRLQEITRRLRELDTEQARLINIRDSGVALTPEQGARLAQAGPGSIGHERGELSAEQARLGVLAGQLPADAGVLPGDRPRTVTRRRY